MTSPTTDRRYGLLGSAAFKAPVTVLAAANITLSGQQTIDGKAVVAVNAAGVPDRVLCTAQTDATQNGIWDVSTAAWTRSVDADDNYDLKKGTSVLVTDGNVYAGTYWQITAAEPITIGTRLITWARALANSISTLFFLQGGAGAVARGAQDKMRERVSVMDYGAIGDGASHPLSQRFATLAAAQAVYPFATALTQEIDWAAIQAAINYVRTRVLASGGPGLVFFPAGVYVVSHSLDGTYSALGMTIIFEGEGCQNTTIKGALVETYPVLDCIGNTRGSVRDMTIDGSAAGSKATTALFCGSPTAASSAGNGFQVENAMFFVDRAGGNADASAGAVYFNCDLPHGFNSEYRGPAGAVGGFDKPANVTSKFQVLSAVLDSTKLTFHNCNFLGSSNCALWYSGGAALVIDSCYLALTNGGAGKDCLKVTDPTGVGGNAIEAYHMRTENQAGSAEFYSINIAAARTFGGHIDGAFDTNTATTAIIRGTSASQLYQYEMNLACTTGAKPMFAANDGGAGLKVTTCNIGTNISQLGTVDYSAGGGTTGGSHGNSFFGLPQTEAMKNLLRNNTRFNGDDYLHGNQRMHPPGTISVNTRPNANWLVSTLTTAYTGGSGEVQISQVTVPANLLIQPVGSNQHVATKILFMGDCIAANAAGRIRLRITQGANNWIILDHNAIVAGVGYCRLEVEIVNVSSNGPWVSAASNINGVVTGVWQDLWGSVPALDLTAAFTIDVLETNNGNNGIRPQMVVGCLI